MAEVLLSPGVLARENDQTFLQQQPVQAGAAILGPTVKGPVGIPTIVTSYSDYTNKYGAIVESGSAEYTYLTSISAYNYFQQGGNTLLVTRIVSGSYTAATSSIITNDSTTTGAICATGSGDLSLNPTFGTLDDDEINFTISGTKYRFIATDPVGGLPVDSPPLYFLSTGSTSAAYVGFLETKIDSVISSIVDTNDEGSGILSVTGSTCGASLNGVVIYSGSGASSGSAFTLGGGINGTGTSNAFTLETLSEGDITLSIFVSKKPT